MNIAVIGLGKLGLPLAALAASRGHNVLGVDTNKDLMWLLEHRHNKLQENGLDDLLAKSWGRMQLQEESYFPECEIVFIVVPTPSKEDGTFSTYLVEQALHRLRVPSGTTIAIVSTVMPGDCDRLAALLPNDVRLCYNPAFIALGSVLRDMLNPDFVLVGAAPGDGNGPGALRKFYDSLHQKPLVVMDRVNAELAKLAINVHLTMRISYANAIARIAEGLPGGDAHTVLRTVGLDSRIGPAYLRPGTPYGGPCFPRDTKALYSLAQLEPLEDFIGGIEDVNALTLIALTRAVLDATSLGSKVAILGLPYKVGTEVSEHSAGVALVARLEAQGRTLGHLENADAVVLCLPDRSYRELDYGERIVIDPWCVLEGCAPKNWVPMGKDVRRWAKSPSLS